MVLSLTPSLYNKIETVRARIRDRRRKRRRRRTKRKERKGKEKEIVCMWNKLKTLRFPGKWNVTHIKRNIYIVFLSLTSLWVLLCTGLAALWKRAQPDSIYHFFFLWSKNFSIEPNHSMEWNEYIPNTYITFNIFRYYFYLYFLSFCEFDGVFLLARSLSFYLPISYFFLSLSFLLALYCAMYFRTKIVL